MSPAGVTPSDFRSDTVTRPSRAMREAMLAAEVGDDVLDGDPTVRRLEQRVAEWLGKEGALFVPSGTMANQTALGAWTRPGDEIVVQRWAHVTAHEGGAPGFVHGVQTVSIGDESGVLDAAEVERAVRPESVFAPRTALVCMEQTHNLAGGRVAPFAELQAVAGVARAAGLRVHLDGARLANAVVASGVPAARWAALADSVSTCVSKGLGAPVGSLVAGDREFLERAARVRLRLGGGMRQAGILAAAGLFALEHNVERLAEDHALAREVAGCFEGFPGVSCDVARVETNIVNVRVVGGGMDSGALAGRLRERGVLALPMSREILRFVTHLDVGRADVERLRLALAGIG